jgi:hypothetical protein
MNPTLSTRLRGWQQSPYWRVHPPAPWAVPLEPATALLHLPAVPAPTGAALPGAALSDVASSDAPAAVALAAVAPAEVALAAVDLPVAGERAVGASVVATVVVGTAAVLAVAPAAPVAPQPPPRAQPPQRQSPARLARNSPRPSAAGDTRSRVTSQLSPLIAVLILALVTLLEGWRAIRLLSGQIRAIWVAPAAGVRVHTGLFPPAVAVPVGVAGPAGPSSCR